MLDKVLKAWECCNPLNRRCFECPYEDDCFHDNFDRVAIADMVKLLKEQQAEIDRLKAEQPKWIPVSERLPKKEDIPYDCLVTLEHGVVCEATFLDMDAPYHKWCANTGWLYHVTHWMPLPKPPKGGEQE